MNYEVWFNARDPITLKSVALTMLFGHDNRQVAELVLEHAHADNATAVEALRALHPGAIVSAEMHMPRAAMHAELERLEAAQARLDAIRNGKRSVHYVDQRGHP